jgi:hypothetical protein
MRQAAIPLSCSLYVHNNEKEHLKGDRGNLDWAVILKNAPAFQQPAVTKTGA